MPPTKRPHINRDGRFQSDKYPSCPPGKVPLSTRDPMAQDLLAEYARRRRVVDEDFSADLEACLRADGYREPPRDKHMALIGWFIHLLQRKEELERELRPYQRRAEQGEEFTAAERRAFLKLLDKQEELVREQGERLSESHSLSLLKTQKALLQRMVKGPRSKRQPKVRTIRGAKTR